MDFWSNASLASLKYSDGNSPERDLLKYSQFCENPYWLVNEVTKQIEKLLVGAVSITPERSKEIMAILNKKISDISNKDAYSFETDEIHSILNSIYQEGDPQLQIAIGLAQGLVNELHNSLMPFVGSKTETIKNIIANKEKFSATEQEALSIFEDESKAVNTIYTIFHEYETSSDYNDKTHSQFCDIIKKDLWNKIIDKALIENSTLSRNKAELILTSFVDNFKNPQLIINSLVGASRKDSSLWGHPELIKIDSSHYNMALQHSVMKEKALEKLLEEKKISLTMQSAKDYLNEVLDIRAQDMFRVPDILNKINQDGNTLAIEESKSFRKLYNALIGIHGYTSGIGKHKEAITYVKNIIPEDVCTAVLENPRLDEKGDKGLNETIKRMLNSSEKINILSQNSSEHDARKTIETIENLRKNTIGDLYSNLVYRDIARTNKEQLHNFEKYGRIGITKAYFGLRACLATSLSEKTHFQTHQSMANECVKKYIDDVKQESDALISTVVNGPQTMILGAMGVGPLLLILASIQKERAHAAQRKLATIEQETAKMIGMLEHVESLTEAESMKFYANVKTSNDDFEEGLFDVGLQKEIKGGVFLAFVKDTSTFYDPRKAITTLDQEILKNETKEMQKFNEFLSACDKKIFETSFLKYFAFDNSFENRTTYIENLKNELIEQRIVLEALKAQLERLPKTLANALNIKDLTQRIANKEQEIKKTSEEIIQLNDALSDSERMYLSKHKSIDTVMLEKMKEGSAFGASPIVFELENLEQLTKNNIDKQIEIVREQERAIREEILNLIRQKSAYDLNMSAENENTDFKAIMDESKLEKEKQTRIFDSMFDHFAKLYLANTNLGNKLLEKIKKNEPSYSNMEVFSLYSSVKDSYIEDILRFATTGNSFDNDLLNDKEFKLKPNIEGDKYRLLVSHKKRSGNGFFDHEEKTHISKPEAKESDNIFDRLRSVFTLSDDSVKQKR